MNPCLGQIVHNFEPLDHFEGTVLQDVRTSSSLLKSLSRELMSFKMASGRFSRSSLELTVARKAFDLF